MFSKIIDEPGYEKVVHFRDEDLGFSCYIAIHSTQLGPALGGCRVKRYNSDPDALNDALRLAQGMTFKNAAAGLQYGGGKCVVDMTKPTPQAMRLVGEAVETFNGQYITAEDVGTHLQDMKYIAEKTKHVVLGKNGDASVWTAHGVHNCIKRLPLILGKMHASVWVQGLGKVGWRLATLLEIDGCKVFVSDIDDDKVERLCRTGGFERYDESKADQVAVYAPCAMGNVVTVANVDTIKFQAICGSANNQLETDDLAEKLQARDILYCPDFIVNAGGVIAATCEVDGKAEGEVLEHVSYLGEVLENVIVMSRYAKTTPLSIAYNLGGARL